MRGVYYAPVASLIDRAHTETAEAAVKSAAEQLGGLRSPREVEQQQLTRRAIADTISLMSTVTGQVNNFTGSGLEEAYQDILAEQPSAGPVSARLSGMTIGAGVSHLNDVLGALKAISDLMDPAKQRAMFDARLGALGYVESGASLAESILTILQGTIAGATGVTAALSTVSGYADDAARLLAQSSRITGGLGKAIAVISIAKGAAAALNDQHSTSDRLSGVADSSVVPGHWQVDHSARDSPPPRSASRSTWASSNKGSRSPGP